MIGKLIRLASGLAAGLGGAARRWAAGLAGALGVGLEESEAVFESGGLSGDEDTGFALEREALLSLGVHSGVAVLPPALPLLLRFGLVRGSTFVVFGVSEEVEEVGSEREGRGRGAVGLSGSALQVTQLLGLLIIFCIISQKITALHYKLRLVCMCSVRLLLLALIRM